MEEFAGKEKASRSHPLNRPEYDPGLQEAWNEFVMHKVLLAISVVGAKRPAGCYLAHLLQPSSCQHTIWLSVQEDGKSLRLPCLAFGACSLHCQVSWTACLSTQLARWQQQVQNGAPCAKAGKRKS